MEAHPASALEPAHSPLEQDEARSAAPSTRKPQDETTTRAAPGEAGDAALQQRTSTTRRRDGNGSRRASSAKAKEAYAKAGSTTRIGASKVRRNGRTKSRSRRGPPRRPRSTTTGGVTELGTMPHHTRRSAGALSHFAYLFLYVFLTATSWQFLDLWADKEERVTSTTSPTTEVPAEAIDQSTNTTSDVDAATSTSNPRVATTRAPAVAPAVDANITAADDPTSLPLSPNHGQEKSGKGARAVCSLFMVLDTLLFLHILLSKGSVSRNGSSEWIVYCWINAPKYALFYFEVLPKIAMEEGVVGPAILTYSVANFAIIYSLLMFRSFTELFVGRKITIHTMLHTDMAWHCTTDFVDIVHMFSYAPLFRETGVDGKALVGAQTVGGSDQAATTNRGALFRRLAMEGGGGGSSSTSGSTYKAEERRPEQKASPFLVGLQSIVRRALLPTQYAFGEAGLGLGDSFSIGSARPPGTPHRERPRSKSGLVTTSTWPIIRRRSTVRQVEAGAASGWFEKDDDVGTTADDRVSSPHHQQDKDPSSSFSASTRPSAPEQVLPRWLSTTSTWAGSSTNSTNFTQLEARLAEERSAEVPIALMAGAVPTTISPFVGIPTSQAEALSVTAGVFIFLALFFHQQSFPGTPWREEEPTMMLQHQIDQQDHREQKQQQAVRSKKRGGNAGSAEGGRGPARSHDDPQRKRRKRHFSSSGGSTSSGDQDERRSRDNRDADHAGMIARSSRGRHQPYRPAAREMSATAHRRRSRHDGMNPQKEPHAHQQRHQNQQPQAYQHSTNLNVNVMRARKRSALVSILFVDLPFLILRAVRYYWSPEDLRSIETMTLKNLTCLILQAVALNSVQQVELQSSALLESLQEVADRGLAAASAGLEEVEDHDDAGSRSRGPPAPGRHVGHGLVGSDHQQGEIKSPARGRGGGPFSRLGARVSVSTTSITGGSSSSSYSDQRLRSSTTSLGSGGLSPAQAATARHAGQLHAAGLSGGRGGSSPSQNQQRHQSGPLTGISSKRPGAPLRSSIRAGRFASSYNRVRTMKLRARQPNVLDREEEILYASGFYRRSTSRAAPTRSGSPHGGAKPLPVDVVAHHVVVPTTSAAPTALRDDDVFSSLTHDSDEQKADVRGMESSSSSSSRPKGTDDVIVEVEDHDHGRDAPEDAKGEFRGEGASLRPATTLFPVAAFDGLREFWKRPPRGKNYGGSPTSIKTANDSQDTVFDEESESAFGADPHHSRSVRKTRTNHSDKQDSFRERTDDAALEESGSTASESSTEADDDEDEDARGDSDFQSGSEDEESESFGQHARFNSRQCDQDHDEVADSTSSSCDDSDVSYAAHGRRYSEQFDADDSDASTDDGGGASSTEDSTTFATSPTSSSLPGKRKHDSISSASRKGPRKRLRTELRKAVQHTSRPMRVLKALQQFCLWFWCCCGRGWGRATRFWLWQFLVLATAFFGGYLCSDHSYEEDRLVVLDQQQTLASLKQSWTSNIRERR